MSELILVIRNGKVAEVMWSRDANLKVDIVDLDTMEGDTRDAIIDGLTMKEKEMQTIKF